MRCDYCDTIYRSKASVLKHILEEHKVNGEDPLMYSLLLLSPKEAGRLLGMKENNRQSNENTNTKQKEKNKTSKKDKVIKRTHYNFGRLANIFSNPDLVENDKNCSAAEGEPAEQTSTVDHTVSSVAPGERTGTCRFRTPFLNNNSNQKDVDDNVDASHFLEQSPSSDSHAADKEIELTRQVKSRRNKSKPPRGKCSDWLNCTPCSTDENCGVCSHCTNKSLQ